MAQVWGNNAISTLSAGIGAGDTTIFIQPSHGSRFPVVAAPNFAFCTLEDASGNIEIVKVTAHTSGASSLTVERGKQGTTARSYIIGDLFELRLTAEEAAAWEADIDTLFATKANKAGDTYTGTHDFTGATAVALPAATSIGNVSATELSYLDGVTSSVQGQLNALASTKANKAGDTYTGAHDFSGAASVALPANTSLGPITAVEFGYLDGVTSSVQGQLNVLASGKADVTGEAYTGTHDFTAGTLLAVTRPTGTNDSTVATMQALQQAVFASYANLPADPGDEFTRVLTTRDGIKSWDIPPPSDVAAYLSGLT
ncbi:MAG: hypothetical protein HY855_10975 [Burkholderiales bacterium]|nr:hypothetical protein [Burkholderiales bacterium]